MSVSNYINENGLWKIERKHSLLFGVNDATAVSDMTGTAASMIIQGEVHVPNLQQGVSYVAELDFTLGATAADNEAGQIFGGIVAYLQDDSTPDPAAVYEDIPFSNVQLALIPDQHSVSRIKLTFEFVSNGKRNFYFKFIKQSTGITYKANTRIFIPAKDAVANVTYAPLKMTILH